MGNFLDNHAYINKNTMSEIEKLAESLPGGFFTYYAWGKEEFIYVSSKLIRMMGCQSREEFQKLTNNSFRGFVYAEDLEQIEADIQRQISMNQDKDDHVSYRVKDATGKMLWVDEYGHLVHTQEYGDIFFVFVADITEYQEILSKKERENARISIKLKESEEELKTQMGIILSLSSDISDLYTLDVSSMEISAYRMAGDAISVAEAMQQSAPYEKMMKGYILNNVHPADQEAMLFITNLDYLQAELKKRGLFIFHYRTLRNGEQHYYYMKCAEYGEEDDLLFAFACEDNQIIRQQIQNLIGKEKQQKKQKILMVGENSLNRQTLKSILEDEFTIIEAHSHGEGFELLQRKQENISLILLDIVTDSSDRYELLKRIQGDLELSATPVVIVNVEHDKMQEERCLDMGAIDYLTKPYQASIVKRRIKNIIQLMETADALEEIEKDDLTGIYTRTAFFHHAKIMLEANPQEDYDLIIADVENFKMVNGTYGEEKADGLLRSLARFMLENTVDGICARYGADQFVSLYKSNKATDQKIRILPDRFKEIAPIPNINVKFGVYNNVDKNLSIIRMCDNAILAIKSIKNNYEHAVAFYDGPVSQQHFKNQLYEASFEEAIKNKEFVVWLQPKYDPYQENVIGAEALVRWEKEKGYFIPPGVFLNVFEKDGLIGKLDEYVFESVCELQSKWKKKGKALMPISVNLSRNSIHPQIVERYIGIAKKYDIDPQYIPIEITETAAVSSVTIKNMEEKIKEAGFPLHMDDFGSGRSSLHTLNVLQYDVIKLDKGLIDYIGDEKGEKVLIYTIALIKDLGMHIVAEGVEDKTQLDFLCKHGCDAIQGYYYSKPLPIDEFELAARKSFKE